eukprot:2415702-Amphidinium_carterae.1
MFTFTQRVGTIELETVQNFSGRGPLRNFLATQKWLKVIWNYRFDNTYGCYSDYANKKPVSLGSMTLNMQS